VTSFSTNDVTFHIQMPSGKPGLLMYADAYAREWHAEIGGREVPIFEANGGFKAVFVPVGASLVELHYGSIKADVIAAGLALAGALFAVTMVTGIIVLPWRGYP
jgi:uncharacterized membrane protein YfhO